ncbi:SDR family NAD(P)-dependent oxidoreductase [Actinacidiphila acidipaludis]|uniref:SDR family NAD(P)-dependent oxidoreductase n=1 Tax=Actinacidiphila acidipaludis TaxID=2873382 RepID=A0ABS7Q6X8_9ACTN|nr:SDR family NAD(P)-dependent oxidoreductase [Streptomyces acidipaludis]MBY8878903.1 SDR family NAD(P)-dependent oxidoreductase [Streptomyces acidipaludis]
MSTILVTGASSGFGALAARALAQAGHIVYASMRDTAGRNAPKVAEAAAWAKENGRDLRTVELDVQSEESARAAIASVLDEQPALDVVVHNAGHMVTGPAEAFSPEQYVQLYDINVLGAQRVNRAALPHMRGRRDGLLVWVGSSSTRGGTPPYLGPYFAAKAAMDALAASYALEVSRFGIETTIVVPGSFTSGTNHYANAGHPEDEEVVKEYEELYGGLMEQIGQRMHELEPPDADVSEVARAIVAVVDADKGSRPFRVHVDPTDDGAVVVNAVADRMRLEFMRRLGLTDLLRPAR